MSLFPPFERAQSGGSFLTTRVYSFLPNESFRWDHLHRVVVGLVLFGGRCLIGLL